MLVQEELQSWQRATDARRHSRQQVRPNGGNEGHLERACEGIAVVARDIDDRVAVLEHPPRARHHLFAGFGQRYALWLALDESDTKVLLQLAQLCTQGRLADEAALRSLAEVALIGERHQIAQVLEFEIAHAPNIRHLSES